jgi:succinate dehydrogenase / fumarate reductase flavoprotein subunit
MRSLLVTAEAVARSALLRQESRGAHTRIDYEGERDEWVKYNIICRKAPDGHMEVEKILRPPPVKYLEEIANSKIEDLESGKIGADAPND